MLNTYHNIKIVYYIGTEWSKNTLVHTLQPTDPNRQNYMVLYITHGLSWETLFLKMLTYCSCRVCLGKQMWYVINTS